MSVLGVPEPDCPVQTTGYKLGPEVVTDDSPDRELVSPVDGEAGSTVPVPVPHTAVLPSREEAAARQPVHTIDRALVAPQ